MRIKEHLSSERLKRVNADPEWQARAQAAAQAVRDRKFCEETGLEPHELDDYRLARAKRFPVAEAVELVKSWRRQRA